MSYSSYSVAVSPTFSSLSFLSLPWLHHWLVCLTLTAFFSARMHSSGPTSSDTVSMNLDRERKVLK